MKLPLEFDELPNLLVFRLSGEMSSYLIDTLKKELISKVRDCRVHRVLINLDGVDYIASKDIGIFVRIYRYLFDECKKHEASPKAILAFSNLGPFIRDIMKLTRLESVFKIYGTEEEAVADLVGEIPENKTNDEK